VGGVEAELEEVRAGIDEGGDAFAGGEAGFFVLGFDGFGAAALVDLLFFVFEGGEEFDEARGVFLEVGGFGVDGGFQDGHRETSDGDGRRYSIRSREAKKQRSKEAKKQRKAYTEIAPTGSG